MLNIEEIKNNPYKYIKTIAMDVVVAIVAVAYIFYQMVSLHPTDVNPLVLLAQAAMGIICGVIIKQSLGENGFSKGYNSRQWQDESEKYDDACSLAVDYTERLDNFYAQVEKEKKEKYRRGNLQAARLKYSMWFDANGDYIGTPEELKKLTLYQKWVLLKCVRVRIYVLNLFSEYATAAEQDTKRERTDKTERTKNTTRNLVFSTLIAVIGVYFIPVLNDWSWASFIASTMQVSIWVLLGVIQLYSNYNFVVQDKVTILRQKKELIARFVKDCQNGLYIPESYKKEETPEEKEKAVEE